MCSNRARDLLENKYLMLKKEGTADVSEMKCSRGVWQLRKVDALQELVLQVVTSMKVLAVGE